MIEAKFYVHQGGYAGFSVSGHAGYAEYGHDIVCASVTSAVQLTINGITEILKQNADVKVLDNEISIQLSDCEQPGVQAFCKALYLHLELLSQDYTGTLKLTNLEV
ncbi:MAG: ribosomal-processing cysteine protease Prp [Massiliimalia sp.]|jgi:uncharacterized protein YsxB (DUF464 family)